VRFKTGICFFSSKHSTSSGRRVQILTDDVAHLLEEERIGGKFETARAMWLQRKGLEQPVHGGFGDTAGAGRFPDSPGRNSSYKPASRC
jgi:hypothetical protein